MSVFCWQVFPGSAHNLWLTVDTMDHFVG